MKIFNWLLRKWHAILLFLYGLMPFLWFKDKYMLRNEEVGYLNYSYLWEKFLYSWSSHVNNGSPATIVDHIILYPVGFFYKIASVLGIPNYIVQRLFLVLIYCLIIYCIYKLIYYFSKDKVISFLSVFFYTLMFYFLTKSFYTAKMFQLFLMPLFFYLFVRYLETKRIAYLALNFIIVFTFQAIFCNLPTAVTTFFVYFIALAYYYTSQVNFSKIKQDFKYIFYFLLTLIPVFFNVFIFYYFSVIYNKKYEKIFFTVNFLGTKLIDIFQLFRGAWWEPQAVYNPRLFFYDNPFIVLISFVLFGFIFIGLFKRKENNKFRKQYLFWSLVFLSFIFLTSGIAKPFGFAYRWMYYKIPLFALFREPWAKFTPLLIFSSTILFAYALKTLRNYKKIVYPLIFLLVLIHGSIFFSNRVFNHKNPGMGDTTVLVPQYWFQAQAWSKEHKNDNILTLPVFYAYPYYHEWYKNEIGNHVGRLPYVFLYSNVITNSASSGPLDKFILLKDYRPQFLPLWNVKYFLDQKDLLASEDIKRTVSVEALQGDSVIDEKPYKTFGELDIYEISDRYFLPHFYIPQNIIYSDEGVESLLDIISFRDWEIRSGVYLAEDRPEIGKLRNWEILEGADGVFVKELKNAIGKEELGVVVRRISLPHVRWGPDDFVYPLVLKKEEYEKWKLRKEPEKLFGKYLFYGGKRIAEIIKFQINETNELTDYSLTDYKEKMVGAIEVLRELKESKNEDFPTLLAKFEGVLWGHREKVEEVEGLGSLVNWEVVFRELEEKIEGLKIRRDFSKLVYKLEAPMKGRYEIFMKNLPASEIGELRNSVALLSEVEDGEIEKLEVGGWVSLGSRDFEKGAQELVLPVRGISENLIDEYLRIRGYAPDSIYRISFDYKAPRGGSFFVAEGKTGEAGETRLSPTGDEFRHFEMFFKSSSEAEKASVHLSISIAQEENLRVERVYQPELMLKSIKPQTSDFKIQTPLITFMKINPTKYRVKVEGVKEPYTLVFSENFHEGWKAYISDRRPVVSDQQYGDIVASYFDGDIKEGTHRNIFLDRSTFETWGKKPLLEERHLLVNGYANSWHIKPEDMEGRENYEIIIEYWPQRLFYISLGVSLATLLGCLGYLGTTLVKRLAPSA